MRALETDPHLRLKTAVTVVIALGLAGCTYTAPAPGSASISMSEVRSQPGGDILARSLELSRSNIRRGGVMVANFIGRLPKSSKEAKIEARRTVAPSGAVEYTVLHRAGDNGVQKDVIARFMNAEIEAAAKHSESIAITPQHYRFKYRGQQTHEDRLVHVFDVQPRHKAVGLFRGELWLDAETGLTVREAGRLVKTPSVFLKEVDFEREYVILSGVSVPKALKTQILTRLWGPAELEVYYSDIALTPGGDVTDSGGPF